MPRFRTPESFRTPEQIEEERRREYPHLNLSPESMRECEEWAERIANSQVESVQAPPTTPAPPRPAVVPPPRTRMSSFGIMREDQMTDLEGGMDDQQLSDFLSYSACDPSAIVSMPSPPRSRTPSPCPTPSPGTRTPSLPRSHSPSPQRTPSPPRSTRTEGCAAWGDDSEPRIQWPKDYPGETEPLPCPWGQSPPPPRSGTPSSCPAHSPRTRTPSPPRSHSPSPQRTPSKQTTTVIVSTTKIHGDLSTSEKDDDLEILRAMEMKGALQDDYMTDEEAANFLRVSPQPERSWGNISPTLRSPSPVSRTPIAGIPDEPLPCFQQPTRDWQHYQATTPSQRLRESKIPRFRTPESFRTPEQIEEARRQEYPHLNLSPESMRECEAWAERIARSQVESVQAPPNTPAPPRPAVVPPPRTRMSSFGIIREDQMTDLEGGMDDQQLSGFFSYSACDPSAIVSPGPYSSTTQSPCPQQSPHRSPTQYPSATPAPCPQQAPQRSPTQYPAWVSDFYRSQQPSTSASQLGQYPSMAPAPCPPQRSPPQYPAWTTAFDRQQQPSTSTTQLQRPRSPPRVAQPSSPQPCPHPALPLQESHLTTGHISPPRLESTWTDGCAAWGDDSDPRIQWPKDFPGETEPLPAPWGQSDVAMSDPCLAGVTPEIQSAEPDDDWESLSPSPPTRPRADLRRRVKPRKARSTGFVLPSRARTEQEMARMAAAQEQQQPQLQAQTSQTTCISLVETPSGRVKKTVRFSEEISQREIPSREELRIMEISEQLSRYGTCLKPPRTASCYRPQRTEEDEETPRRPQRPLRVPLEGPVYGPELPYKYGSSRPPPRTSAGKLAYPYQPPCKPSPTTPPRRPMSTPPTPRGTPPAATSTPFPRRAVTPQAIPTPRRTPAPVATSTPFQRDPCRPVTPQGQAIPTPRRTPAPVATSTPFQRDPCRPVTPQGQAIPTPRRTPAPVATSTPFPRRAVTPQRQAIPTPSRTPAPVATSTPVQRDPCRPVTPQQQPSRQPRAARPTTSSSSRPSSRSRTPTLDKTRSEEGFNERTQMLHEKLEATEEKIRKIECELFSPDRNMGGLPSMDSGSSPSSALNITPEVTQEIIQGFCAIKNGVSKLQGIVQNRIEKGNKQKTFAQFTLR